MLASMLIVFREVFEAGLIVGIVAAATRGILHRGLFIAVGVSAGIAGAVILAFFAGALSDALGGRGQEVFNAGILVVAVVMLGWHNLWMASHGREMARQMKVMGQAVAAGEMSLIAMAVVVGVAVLREGAEVVLFLYGIAASTNEGWAAMLLGGALGIALGAAISLVIYAGLLAIPVHRLFSVTSWLIALVAAGMAGQAAAVLAGADLIPTWGYQLWDSRWLLSQDSILGRALHALIGYADRPMGVQLAAYVVVLVILVIGERFVGGRSASPTRSSSQSANPSRAS